MVGAVKGFFCERNIWGEKELDVSQDEQIVFAMKALVEDRWEESHEVVGKRRDKLSCLIHALLHRIEGDDGNAGYWYRMAGEGFPENSIEEETERLSAMIL